MDSYRHVTVMAPTLKEGDWYNLHFDRFALCPLAFDLATEPAGKPVDGQTPLRFMGTAHDLAEHVDALAARFVTTKNVAIRRKIAAQFVALHGEGRLLWPTTLLFGVSTLGEVGKIVRNTVLAASPRLAALRKGFGIGGEENLDHNVLGSRCRMWSFIVGLHFASTSAIDEVTAFKVRHLHILADIVRPGGVRDIRIPTHIDSAMNGLAEHFRVRAEGFGEVHIRRQKARGGKGDTAVSHAPWLAPAWQEWMAGKDILYSRHHTKALKLLNGFFATLPSASCDTPGAAFARANMKALLVHAADWSTPDPRRHAMSKIRDFAEWLSIESADDPTLRFRPELFEQDIVRARAKWGPRYSGPRRKMTRPMPLPMHAMCKAILTDDDFAWPKSLTGSLSQWFAWHGPDGEMRQQFCPVMSRLLLLLLDLPIRGVQARRLDSGEGDDRRWDTADEAWFLNTGRHAGHWRRARARNTARGAIHEILSNGRTMTGLWINSNKTQDRRTLCDETSGYVIPWEDPAILANLDAMRNWQEAFNPVEGPTPHRELMKGLFDDDPTALVAPHIPDRFYLFRSPLNVWQGGNRQPSSRSELTRFFLALLDELERRWAAENPNDALEIILRRKNGVPTKAIFTIHGMRAATLTGLHQAGVPIGIVSKMVAGHASILMTLGYMNYEPHHVSELINAARVTRDSRDQEQFRAFLKRASFQDAMRRTAGMGDALPRDPGGNPDLALCSRLDIGICPNGGTLCAEGGPYSRSGAIATPGGPMNCIRCRFFRTGYPFLIPLWAKGNALLAEADGHARRALAQQNETVALKAERATLRAAAPPVPVPEALDNRIRALAEASRASCAMRDARFDDFHVTLELIEMVRALGPEGDIETTDENLPVRFPAEVPEVGGRPASRFEVTDAVVHASRHYPSLGSPEIEAERDGMMDRIAYRAGYAPPSLTALGPAERRRSADAFARLLLSELKASEMDDLVEGRKTLSDHARLEERFRAVCLEVTGRPVPRIGVAQTTSVAVDDEGEG